MIATISVSRDGPEDAICDLWSSDSNDVLDWEMKVMQAPDHASASRHGSDARFQSPGFMPQATRYLHNARKN